MTAALIARLEEATGPDGECDVRLFAFDGDFEIVAEREGDIELRKPDGRIFTLKAVGGFYAVERYTGSIDAALALVPPRSLWSVCDMEHGPYAQVVRPMPGGGYVHGLEVSKGATPAIALCIAALKARAAGGAQ